MMRSLVSRLYVALALMLLVVGLGVALLVDTVNRWRFESHLNSWLPTSAELIRDGLLRQPGARQDEWLGVLAALTGAGWQIAETPVSELTVSSVQWSTQQAEVRIPLDQQSAIKATVTEWVELRIGLGYLLLNELSRHPASERAERLEQLTANLPFPVASVRVPSIELGFLGERQIAQGQAHVRADGQTFGASEETLYLPMGDTHVLKMGPWIPFNWVTPAGLLFTLLGTLALLAGMMALLLWPLQRRLYRFTQSVDRITADPDSIAVPEQPADELGNMGRHVNAMALRLADLVRRNQELNQAVSHDLKTPLARIRFALELMNPTKHQLADAETVYQSVDELEALVNELLLFHRLSADPARKARWHEIAPSRLVDQVMTAYVETETVVTCTTSERLWLLMESATLKRMLRNLLDNACRHAKNRIALDLSESSERLLIQVDDDGPGIPESDRKRVFEPFVRLDTARSSADGGHGLGLAICYTMANKVGGRIDITSSPLGGAKVRVELPMHLAEHKQSPTNP